MPAQAFEGRWRIEGQEADGTATKGVALVDERDGVSFRLLTKTCDKDGTTERRVETRATLGAGGVLRWSQKAVRNEFLPDPPLTAVARLDAEANPPVLRVIYRDEQGKPVRRELWTRDESVAVPVALVGLVESEAFARGIPADALGPAGEQVLAQLSRVYAPLGVKFVRAGEPLGVAGEKVDADHDGKLSRDEVATLRDELEKAGTKRPGRVVIVLTGGTVVGRGCRGITLGDAPRNPTSLRDFNDNFSLIGLRYVDATRYHTVAHEVGHQLGLDDLARSNRMELRHPERDDHLMLSGGTGTFIDPAARELLLKGLRQPDHGLAGRRTALTLDFGDEERTDLGPLAPAPR